MLQTYGAVSKCCSLSCEGGMMIEYMSTVILTGFGPEVCVTSNNTQQRLRRQTEKNWGHWRRREGGGGWWDMETVWEKKGGTDWERQTNESVRRALSFKTFKLLS